MPQLSASERDFALQTVRRAGDFALSHWISGEERRPFTVKEKEDGSPVTTVDLAVNEMLIAEFSRMFPQDGFYTEEADPVGDLNSAESVWLIDPVDGTAHFIDGEREFGVLVARVENGTATFGAAYFPAYDAFLWAERGSGAFFNDEPLQVSHATSLMPERVYVRNGRLSHANYRYPEELGTAHGFFYLCSGKVDGLIAYIKKHQEWDIGPWIPIVQESGGMITDQNGGEIRFTFQDPSFSALVASHQAIHPALLDLVVDKS